MKKIMQLLLVTSMLFFLTMQSNAQPIPSDSLYLGQTPPGNTPKIFNLPVTGTNRACERIAISSDGKEIYYGELNTYPATVLRVRCFKYQNNKWEGPFNVFEGFMAPKFSNNDSIIYLQNNNFYTYYSKRISTGWSTPARVFSKNLKTHYLQKTNLNNTYASSYYEGSPSDGDICRLITVNQDTILQSLGLPLNSTMPENDFLIDANESYMLFSRGNSSGASDIYLSFKKVNDKWTNPKKLGEPINKPGAVWEYGQFVSQDGKYLFYTSGGTNWSLYYTYWVKIDNIIDSLRHTNFAPYLNYQIPNRSIEAGNSFNYTISDTTFIDDDGNNTLTYSSTLSNGNPLPAWLSFNSATKTFSGTPNEAMNLIVKVTATDNANSSVTTTFTLNVNITEVEDTKDLLPVGLYLNQNYPNPFNPTTTIEFAIPKSGRYNLGIYNTLGELVMSVSNKEYLPGYYKETFNASGLSSGVYIYRLAGNDANLLRKMVVLR